MGNDGGSIPKRRELVKNAARAPTVSELKATALESHAHAWTHCALSGAGLDMEAVVSDWRGHLYNYEAILKGLVPSDDTAEPTPASLGITSLRDVVKLKFARSSNHWSCPISMKELGPATKAVYLVPCGHVFAEVAITEIRECTCPECAAEFHRNNIIILLPTTEEDTQRLEKRMQDLRAKGLTHTLKKNRSDKKKKRKGDDLREGDGGLKYDKVVRNDDKRPTEANSGTAKVLAEQDEINKRRKLASAVAPRKGEVAKG